MHHYPHHIGDFNSATRHLTRVERSLYRDLIELYYDSEQPLPADDFDRLARRAMASSEEEKAALKYVLSEFFTLDGNVYRNERCDKEIAQYRENIEKKTRAGKASAEAKKQKETAVQQVLNTSSTNQSPRTNHQEPEEQRQTTCVEPLRCSSPAVITVLTNKGEEFPITEDLVAEWTEAYPAVDVPQELRKIRAWALANKAKRKTRGGMLRAVNSWLSREQDKGGKNFPNAGPHRPLGAEHETSLQPRKLSLGERATEHRKRFEQQQAAKSEREIDGELVGADESHLSAQVVEFVR